MFLVICLLMLHHSPHRTYVCSYCGHLALPAIVRKQTDRIIISKFCSVYNLIEPPLLHPCGSAQQWTINLHFCEVHQIRDAIRNFHIFTVGAETENKIFLYNILFYVHHHQRCHSSFWILWSLLSILIFHHYTVFHFVTVLLSQSPVTKWFSTSACHNIPTHMKFLLPFIRFLKTDWLTVCCVHVPDISLPIGNEKLVRNRVTLVLCLESSLSVHVFVSLFVLPLNSLAVITVTVTTWQTFAKFLDKWQVWEAIPPSCMVKKPIRVAIL